ncbi:MAG TPA: two-component sensor histidine kinase [Clostridium sp.]|nr:two-component sensor histidine kinase [Clostridium sp.]
MYKIKNMSLNKKILIFFICVLLATNIINLVVTYTSAVKTITEKSTWLAKGQVQSMKNSLLRNLNDLNELTRIMRFDNRIQDYFMYDGTEINDIELSITDSAYKSIRYMSDIKKYIDYIGLIKYSKQQVVYVGETWTNSDFKERILDYYSDENNTQFESLRVSINENIFRNNQYVLNFFQPVYDRYELNKELGFIVIGVKEETLQKFYNDYESDLSFNLCLVNRAGKIISDKNHALIGKEYEYINYLTKENGNVIVYNNMIVYDYVEGYDFYIVGNIETDELFTDSRKTMTNIIVVIIIITFLSGIVSCYLINQLYYPINDIVENMSKVSQGKLDVVMENKYSGEDFIKMTNGFNSMINEINVLLNKVKEEQNQINKIELNALQSQIKPHFLYNTLECIHWKALADGNKEVSDMVKALANYYRICLSRGKDIIPLHKEIEHIKNYLIIQNMRYSHIVESGFVIEEECMNVMIPKMTLQPLVENSIYHGMRIKENYTGRIEIKAEAKENYALISVEDTGVGMDENEINILNNSLNSFDKENGYGVKNVNKRIAIIFGREYGLHYLKNSYGGITVEIKLPLEK